MASSSITAATESIVAGNVAQKQSPVMLQKYNADAQSCKRNNQTYGSKDKVKKELFTSSFNEMTTETKHDLSQDIAKLEDVRESLNHIISPINNRITYQNDNANHISSSPISDQLSNGFHDIGQHNESLDSMKTEALLSVKPHVSTGSMDSGIVFSSGTHRHVPESSLLTENQILRDSLDRERYRRKHCEEQISELQAKLLESQQQLAVAVSTDRKKDIMVQQLDKTLAKVVDGWKKNEEEKIAVIEKMKGEKEEAEKLQDRQKQLLAAFEKDLAQAVDQLSKEQKRAISIEKDKQAEIQSLKEEKEAKLLLVQEEKRKRQTTEEMKEELHKQIKELQDRLAKERDSSLETQHKLQKELLMMSEKHQKELESEKELCAKMQNKSTEAQTKLNIMQAEINELKEQRQDYEQEKENLRLEVEMQAAKFEASQLRQETERQAEVEKTVGQRMKELEKKIQIEQKSLQDIHRQQVQTLLNNHQKEVEAMEAKTQEELQNNTIRWTNLVQDLQQRLNDSNMEMNSLKQRLDVEGGHYLDVIGQFQSQCQQLMQWIQILRNPDRKKEQRNQSELQKDMFPKTTTVVGNIHWTPPKKSKPLTSSSPAVKLTSKHTSSPARSTTNMQQHPTYMQELPPASADMKETKPRTSKGYTNRVLFSNPQSDVSAFTETRPRLQVDSKGYPGGIVFSKPGKVESRPEESIEGYRMMFTNASQNEPKPEASLVDYSSSRIITTTPLQTVVEASLGDYPGRMIFTKPVPSDTSSFKPLHPQFDDQQTSSFLSEQELADQVPEKEDSVTDMSVGPLESTVIERDTYNLLSDKFQKHTEKQQELQHYIQMLLERSPGSPIPSKESDSPPSQALPKSNNTANDNGEKSSTEILTLDQLSEISKLINRYNNREDDGRDTSQQPATPDQMMNYLKMMQSRVANVQQQQRMNQGSEVSHVVQKSMVVMKDKPTTGFQDFNLVSQKDHTTRTCKSKPAKTSASEAKSRTKNQRGSLLQPTKQSQASRKAIWK